MMRDLASGQLNRALGWAMLLAGIAAAAVLDPWFFAAQSAGEYADSLRPAVRHAQGVVLGMALLQLAMGHLLRVQAFRPGVQSFASLAAAGGAIVYAAGYGWGLWWPAAHPLVLAGSFLNVAAFGSLIAVGPSGPYAAKIRMLLPVVCFGMALDFVGGLLLVLPEDSVLSYLGAEDQLRLRMMRLARVAAIALSVLTMLFVGLTERGDHASRRPTWAGWSLACGAVGMPAILAAACFTLLYLKYLLAIPATLVTVAVAVGFLLAIKHATWLERWGWLLVLVSISSGMLIGMYAFDGPLPTPELMGEYNELPRRLTRIAHSYCIVLGILAIFLARETGGAAPTRLAKFSEISFIAGSVITVGVLALRVGVSLPPVTYSVGPVVVVLAAAMCLVSARHISRAT